MRRVDDVEWKCCREENGDINTCPFSDPHYDDGVRGCSEPFSNDTYPR